MNKLIGSVKEAIEKAGLKDGMTISFHHHMRNGDYVLNMVLDAAARMGIRDLTVNASSIFDIHEPIIEHIKNGVVTGLECNYMGAKVGKAFSEVTEEEPEIWKMVPQKLTLLFWQRPVQMRWETAAENTARQPAVLWDTHFLTRCMQTR